MQKSKDMVAELMFGTVTVTLTYLLWERKINVEDLDCLHFLNPKIKDMNMSGQQHMKGMMSKIGKLGNNIHLICQGFSTLLIHKLPIAGNLPGVCG